MRIEKMQPLTGEDYLDLSSIEKGVRHEFGFIMDGKVHHLSDVVLLADGTSNRGDKIRLLLKNGAIKEDTVVSVQKCQGDSCESMLITRAEQVIRHRVFNPPNFCHGCKRDYSSTQRQMGPETKVAHAESKPSTLGATPAGQALKSLLKNAAHPQAEPAAAEVPSTEKENGEELPT